MVLGIKRRLAALVSNDLTGRWLSRVFSDKIPCPRYGGLRFDCSDAAVIPEVKASIFWGSYEGAEVRLVRKWLGRGHDVIELGGSIGVMACHIAEQISPRKLVTLEASPRLCGIIEDNLRLNALSNATVVSGAIGRPGESLFLHMGEINTTGTVSTERSADALEVPTTTLGQVAATHGMKDYVLVCDIEGSELAVLLDDAPSLSDCRMIFMEAHSTVWDGRHYSISDIKNLIVDLGFDVLDRQGVNFVFIRRGETA